MMADAVRIYRLLMQAHFLAEAAAAMADVSSEEETYDHIAVKAARLANLVRKVMAPEDRKRTEEMHMESNAPVETEVPAPAPETPPEPAAPEPVTDEPAVEAPAAEEPKPSA